MATKTRAGGLNGMHTAGIYSDMTVDGPEIGTLVVIVDRAKNLPNRKTIGKQDPYCAARLGKEAKKTETDRRGGQTPRWDQELRFTVHDSPDYYQLKVSVFNDDKKTDLIGETWVNLQEVVVPGGGQSDVWHNLGCKGKYAGEIRIEMTYYDTRPKEEKQVERVRQAVSNSPDDGGASEQLKGPRQPQQKSPVKRRPLPSDPVSGAPSPIAIPSATSAPASVAEQSPKFQRGYSQPQPSIPEHVQGPVRGYSAPSTAPSHVQTPPRRQTYIPNQSPLQNVEYNTPQHQNYHQPEATYSPTEAKYSQTNPIHPEPRYDQSDCHYSQPYGTPGNREYNPIPRAITPTSNSPVENRYGYERRGGQLSRDGGQRYDEGEDVFDPYRGDLHHVPYEIPSTNSFDAPPSPEGPPPPPPVHRSRHGSAQPSPVPPLSTHGSFGFSENPTQSQYGVSTRDVQRHSMPSYQRQGYQVHRSSTFDHASSPVQDQASPPRHNSYDSRYDTPKYNSMQPTVEDAPSSPSVRDFGTSPSYYNATPQQYSESSHDQVPSPAPLNLAGRSSTSTTPSHQYSNSSFNYVSSDSHSYRERANTETTLSSRTSYNSLPQHHQPIRRMSEDPTRSSYSLPPVPASLVPGIDPFIAQEISDRIYDEKRAGNGRSVAQPPRGGYQISPHQQPKQPKQPHPLSFQEPVDRQYDAPPASPYDERPGRYAAANTAVVKPRAISPDPRRPIRKSVSPSPGPTPGDESRRLSGVPFGPDSYNALNPTVASSVSTNSLSAKYDPKEPDPDAKIITHDGREIDPSDHIPESNYAPLHEVKGPKYASQLPDRNYRPPPASSAQHTPNSGRRPLRQAGRPQSMVASSPSYPPQSSMGDPATPPNRNRLQKKSNRMAAQPASYSSPLAPITPHQDNSYVPRSQGRGSVPDYHSNENYTPQYGGSPGYQPHGPPIPAKVPMQTGGQSPLPPQQYSGHGDAWTLLDEMKNIDLGTGRSRRRQY